MASVLQLLREVARRQPVGAAELLEALGVSRATLSRLVAEAGPELLRLGKARATRYVRTREIPGLPRSVPVYRVAPSGDVQMQGSLHFLADGRHWLMAAEGEGELYEGLPPFAADMVPQGYLGRGFSARHPELGLPDRITDWNDDHRLIALSCRGEDCIGDVILGDESFQRFVSSEPEAVQREMYPELALRSAAAEVGSSAGGEHPKFGVYSQGRHVLVKFAGGEGEGAQRWRDLLWCEWHALHILRERGFQVATGECFDVGGFRFLELERFDRVGARGRRGLLSLGAIDNEYFGQPDSWTKAAQRLVTSGRLPAEQGRVIRWWDAFGELIGNTDRHFGNISFFPGPDGALRLAPAYDMLPMVLAPTQVGIVQRPFSPRPPTSDNFDVWREAAKAAADYWTAVEKNQELHPSVRGFAAMARAAVVSLAGRVGGQ